MQVKDLWQNLRLKVTAARGLRKAVMRAIMKVIDGGRRRNKG
jgi:hypothetical protein